MGWEDAGLYEVFGRPVDTEDVRTGPSGDPKSSRAEVVGGAL